jgi:hypothetical protein
MMSLGFIMPFLTIEFAPFVRSMETYRILLVQIFRLIGLIIERLTRVMV